MFPFFFRFKTGLGLSCWNNPKGSGPSVLINDVPRLFLAYAAFLPSVLARCSLARLYASWYSACSLPRCSVASCLRSRAKAKRFEIPRLILAPKPIIKSSRS